MKIIYYLKSQPIFKHPTQWHCHQPTNNHRYYHHQQHINRHKLHPQSPDLPTNFKSKNFNKRERERERERERINKKIKLNQPKKQRIKRRPKLNQRSMTAVEVGGMISDEDQLDRWRGLARSTVRIGKIGGEDQRDQRQRQ